MKPILFSTEMVRAILDGSKTMTRRVVSKNNSFCEMPFNALNLKLAFATESFSNQAILKAPVIDDNNCIHRIWPKWKVGDRLWVRETWCQDLDHNIFYKADNCPPWKDTKWKPSIFMRREHSRITLEITNIRVERLQEMSYDDWVADFCPSEIDKEKAFEKSIGFKNQTECASKFWDSINGKKHPWSSNPWVWVISFRRSHERD